jgi:hypothetical protein
MKIVTGRSDGVHFPRAARLPGEPGLPFYHFRLDLSAFTPCPSLLMSHPSVKPIWISGAILFVVSFFLRTEGLYEITAGYDAFLAVPQFLWPAISEGKIPREWQGQLLMVSLWVGWLSNFTVFPHPWRLLSMAGIAGPWMLMLGMVFLFGDEKVAHAVLGFVPFYPWALGIGLINFANLQSIRAKGFTASAGQENTN